MAESSIPIEECDTLASLRIKADLVGAQLYHQAISRIARGDRTGRPQDARAGRTYRAPGEYRVWRLERSLRRRARRLMPALRTRPSALAQARVLAQFALLSPLLAATRRALERQGRSPFCIFFYHLVANRPLNHMCLPLEEFVRQVEFIRRHHPIVPLDEAVAALPLPDGGPMKVALTFDDGYRDNTWAIEYLRYLSVPATFFVSIGHVRDGSGFEHDLRRGHAGAPPMSVADLRALAERGFLVGSHGIHHEDLGAVNGEEAERILAESRRLIGELTGSAPDHFSFPKGQRGTNITAAAYEAATRCYRHVYSAYGGYNFHGSPARHLRRIGNPSTMLELAQVLAGYTGLRACLAGNSWGRQTASLAPYVAAGAQP